MSDELDARASHRFSVAEWKHVVKVREDILIDEKCRGPSRSPIPEPELVAVGLSMTRRFCNGPPRNGKW